MYKLYIGDVAVEFDSIKSMQTDSVVTKITTALAVDFPVKITDKDDNIIAVIDWNTIIPDLFDDLLSR